MKAKTFSYVNSQNLYYFFSASYSLKKYCFGVEVAPAYQVIKRIKMDHLFTRCIPLHAATTTEFDKNKKTGGGLPVTKLLNTCTR